MHLKILLLQYLGLGRILDLFDQKFLKSNHPNILEIQIGIPKIKTEKETKNKKYKRQLNRQWAAAQQLQPTSIIG
jgi:hypothetical protein